MCGTEELAGIESAIADEVVTHAVKLIGAALGHQFDTGSPMAVGSVHKIDLNFEFLERVPRKGDGRVIPVTPRAAGPAKRGACRTILDTADRTHAPSSRLQLSE